MTAVAPPPNFQPGASRAGWTNGAATNGISSMSPDEFSKMVMPRKTAQRSNSSSSLSSQASSSSSTSTISASSAHVNGVSPNNASDWGTKKRPARSLWPASKAEPISGISTARPQSIASTTGPSATSAMTALHTPSSMLPSQNGAMPQAQTNGVVRTPNQNEPSAMLWLSPMNGTFERKQITVPYYPETLRIGRQTNNKTQPQPNNGYFDSKVLSRQHAETWADRNGKIWIRDVKSSNGTFVNGQRLSAENKDSDPHELREQDVLELGIDIVSEDQKTVVHHKVAAKVELAGFYTNGPNLMDLNFGDLDAAAANGLLGGQDLGPMRGRAGSQGSIGSAARMGGVNGMPGGAMMGLSQQRQPMWLQTITMDQVVKKINTEFKMARQQTQDLQRTNAYIESLLTSDTKKDKPPAPAVKPSPIKDLKARFSDPPAPPPQQPLPEKPDIARSGMDAIMQPFLRRSDTERPKLTSSISSPGKSASGVGVGDQLQITQLVEALNAAKKELEAHNAKLKEVEDMLAQERQARESAEERAQRLEMEHKDDKPAPPEIEEHREIEMNGSIVPSTSELVADGEKALDSSAQSTTASEDQSTTLQQRLDQVLGEMTEMKSQMEKYRTRAEKAEEASTRDRKTLAEMIEKVRQDEEKRIAARAASRGRRSRSASTFDQDSSATVDGAAESQADTAIKGEKEGDEEVAKLFKKAGLQNGRPVTPEQVKQLEEAVNQALATRQRRGEQLAQVGPYASILGVVFAGVALMAYLNGWQKVER
ncbi:hypothetical protein NA57DRAFT_70212 [Rhizodiscina lignyota]|uniref:FHA domain-containing protein n=1 Tax=Rhizodiscina lignyota TaxID=1504668 RepID=A0A9P4IM04_9PEZI|nr:hypothetical protein NA57DRAFT_70212 [Rhizodiscina lignyota]